MKIKTALKSICKHVFFICVVWCVSPVCTALAEVTLPEHSVELPVYLSVHWEDLSNSLIEIFTKQQEDYSPTSKKLDGLISQFKAVESRPESKGLQSLRREDAKLSEKYNTAPENAWFRSTRGEISQRRQEVRRKIYDAEREERQEQERELQELDRCIQQEIASLRKQRDDEINGLLDKALGMLIESDAKSIRKEVMDLQDRNKALHKTADELRNKRIIAPESSLIPWKTTKRRIDKNLAVLEEEISENNARLEQLNDQLMDEVQKLGIEGSTSQIRSLLDSALIDDFLQNTTIFANMKIIVEQLQNLMQNNRSNLELNRRYLGMYVVLNDLLIHAQTDFVNKIDEDYKPRLAAMLREANERYNEAEWKSEKYKTREQQEQIQILLAKTERTIEAGRRYSQLLDAQRKDTLQLIETVKDNRELAYLAYRIEKSALGMIDLVHSGLLHFDSLKTLSMPQLQILEDDAVKQELAEINEKLKASLKD